MMQSRMGPSLETLYGQHRAGLAAYGARLVGSTELGQDLAQEAFVRAARDLPHGEDANQVAWLYRVVRNLAVDHHRYQARRPSGPQLVEPGRRESQETRLEVRKAVDEVPDLDREVFLLREVGGLSYGEIASACGLTVESVRARMFRTRQRLREVLSAPVSRVSVVQWMDAGKEES